MKNLKKIISLLLLSLFITIPFCAVNAEDGYTEINIVQGISPTVSGTGSTNSPNNLTDGSDSSVSDFWGFQNFVLDFGAEQTITSASLYFRPETAGTYTAKLYAKGITGDYEILDTKNYDNSAGTRHNETLEFDFNAADARYVKVEITTNKSNVVLYEFKVFKSVHAMLGATGKTVPLSGAENVSNVGASGINNIEVLFGQSMNEATLIPANISVYETDTPANTVDISSSFTKDSTKVSFPITLLEENTKYTVKLSADIQFADTAPVGYAYSFNFKTGPLVYTGDPSKFNFLTDIAVIKPANATESVSNVDTEGFVEVDFTKDMLTSSYSEGIIVTEKESGTIVPLTWQFGNRVAKFDMYQLTSDTEYLITLRADKLQIDSDEQITGNDMVSSFKTGLIVNAPQKAGTKIKNVLLNKKIYPDDDSANNYKMVDGDPKTEWIINNKETRYAVDLGNAYNIIGIRFSPDADRDYSGTGNDYHIKGQKISIGLLNRDDSDKNLIHTTVKIGNGEPTYLEVNDWAKYVSIETAATLAVVGELEAFAYVDVNYDVTVSNSGNSYTFKVKGYNFENENKKAQLLISQYDTDGKLVSAAWHDFNNNYGQVNGTNEADFTCTKTGKIVAVLVDSYDGFKMLTDPIVIE